jgi:hypothetical protein
MDEGILFNAQNDGDFPSGSLYVEAWIVRGNGSPGEWITLLVRVPSALAVENREIQGTRNEISPL